jgi:hypothetical protein
MTFKNNEILEKFEGNFVNDERSDGKYYFKNGDIKIIEHN